MNRRRFLRTSAGVASLAALPSGRAQSNDAPGIHLSVATYSLREFQRDHAIRMVKQLNVDYVDIKDVHLSQNDTPAQIAAGRKAFDKAGLKVVGGGNIGLPEADEAGMRKHFEYAKAAGFPMMICAPTRQNLDVVEKLAKEFQIRIAIHNHGPEDQKFPTPRSVQELIRDMDPLMGHCIDIGHTARAGQDIVEAIVEAGPRLFELHMKDLRNTDPSPKSSAAAQVAVGDGILPIPAIFRQLLKQNYTGVCSLEYEVEGDNPLPGMQKSFAYMRGVIAGMRS